MSCLCGSQTKSTAPPTINPVDIGVLCFLFEVEGELCELLDLLPEVLKAVYEVNPDKGNATKLFNDLIKKVVVTTLGSMIDVLTGDIDVTSFCSNPPPPLLDDINFIDVFRFMAEVIPIVDLFFKTGEILTGDSTTLLDKIVRTWLYQQWFQNCECKDCDDREDKETPPPPFVIPEFCDDGNGNLTKRCRNLSIFTRPSGFIPWIGSNQPFQDLTACHGFWLYTSENYVSGDGDLPNGIASYSKVKSWFPLLEAGQNQIPFSSSVWFYHETRLYIRESEQTTYPLQPRVETQISNGRWITETTSEYRLQIWEFDVFYTDKFGNRQKFTGDNTVKPYPPCPPPPPPQEFCDLFPDHPDCVGSDDDDCEIEYALVGKFVSCELLFRQPKRLALNKTGVEYFTDVQKFTACGADRATSQIAYLECETPPPPPDPCDGVDCFEQTSNIQGTLTNAYDNGEITADENSAYSYLQNSGLGLNFDCCESEINSEIATWVNGFN